MIEKVQDQINSNQDKMQKGLADQHVAFVRFENDFNLYKQEQQRKLASGEDDGGSKKISPQQKMFNVEIKERIENMES